MVEVISHGESAPILEQLAESHAEIETPNDEVGMYGHPDPSRDDLGFLIGRRIQAPKVFSRSLTKLSDVRRSVPRGILGDFAHFILAAGREHSGSGA
jgi:hypothetical protein